MEEILKFWCKTGIRAAFPDLEDPPVALGTFYTYSGIFFYLRHLFYLGVSSRPEFGDYQLNSAMTICQLLGKLQRTVWKPRQVAEKIQANLPWLYLVEKVEVAGPGFINIFLNSKEIASWTCETFIKGIKPPKAEKRLRIVVDYSSPNIAKEMHVGHLR